MAGGLMDVPSRTRSSPVSATRQDLGWLPVALGSAVIVAGLGSRKTSTMTLALTALAGLAAATAVRGVEFERVQNSSRRKGGKPEVERSITIGKTADELRRRWLDPTTLPKLMAGFVTVKPVGNGRMHWTIEGPTGRTYEWDTETVENQPNEGIGWRSLPNAGIANEGSIRFHPAPADRGTVATLRLRFEPPGGALGDAAVHLFGTTPFNVAVDDVLQRFKSLVETGEIPTTERQPAARADTR